MEAELAAEHTPQGYSWLAVLTVACAKVGARVEHALLIVQPPGGEPYFNRDAAAVAGRRLSWAVVRELGVRGGVRVSLPRIGRVWAETDHTSVLAGVRAVKPDAVEHVIARLAELQAPPPAPPAPPPSGSGVVGAAPPVVVPRGCQCGEPSEDREKHAEKCPFRRQLVLLAGCA